MLDQMGMSIKITSEPPSRTPPKSCLRKIIGRAVTTHPVSCLVRPTKQLSIRVPLSATEEPLVWRSSLQLQFVVYLEVADASHMSKFALWERMLAEGR